MKEVTLKKMDWVKNSEVYMTENEMIAISKKAGIYNNWISRIKAWLFPKPITTTFFSFSSIIFYLILSVLKASNPQIIEIIQNLTTTLFSGHPFNSK